MSKYTIIGDPHCSPDNLDKIEKLFSIIEDLGNPTILLGDLLNNKEIIRGRCLNLIYDKLSKSKLEYIILVGNHDWYNLECKDHSLFTLKDLKNVTIVEDLLEIEGMFFLPYIHDLQTLKNKLQEIPSNAIVIAHLDICGFDYGNGHLASNGLSLGDLKQFKKVISGHFHKLQESDNLLYLGTPFSHSFGESNQEKYIGVLDSNSGSVELLKSKFPQHVTVEIDCNNSNLPEIIKSEENYLRIILTGKSENIENFRNSCNIEPGVKIIQRPTNDFDNSVKIEETLSNAKKFAVWAKDIKGLDQETMNLGLEILGAIK